MPASKIEFSKGEKSILARATAYLADVAEYGAVTPFGPVVIDHETAVEVKKAA